jgi:hypothetical protein
MFAVKFGMMVITAIAGRIFPPLVFVLPLFYLAVVFAFAINMPYICKWNNYLSMVLYATDAAFSLIPILAQYGIQVPAGAVTPLTVILIVVPALMVVLLLFSDQSAAKDDPTRSAEKRGAKRDKHAVVDEEPQDAPIGEEDGGHVLQTMRHKHQSTLSADVDGDFGADIGIEKGYMDTISFTEMAMLNALPKGRPFNVGERALVVRCKKMYGLLDTVLDGGTIDLLTNALTLARLAGAIGFGWYLGAVRASVQMRFALNC